jgi:hypothetical protein
MLLGKEAGGWSAPTASSTGEIDMTRLRTASVLFALCLLAAPGLTRASAEPWDAARIQHLATRLGEAAERGYRLQRAQGDGTATRLAVRLRRLRVQTRVLSTELENGRSPEELRPVVLNIQALARDVAEEATEGFASAHFAETATQLETSANDLVLAVTQPPPATRQIAFETDSRSGE